MWRVYLREHRTVGPWVSRFEASPHWAIKAAVLATVLMIVIPIVLLCVAALVVGLVVFVALTMVAWLLASVRRFWHHLLGHPDSSPGRDLEPPWRDDGRRNVRVRIVGR